MGRVRDARKMTQSDSFRPPGDGKLNWLVSATALKAPLIPPTLRIEDAVFT